MFARKLTFFALLVLMVFLIAQLSLVKKDADSVVVNVTETSVFVSAEMEQAIDSALNAVGGPMPNGIPPLNGDAVPMPDDIEQIPNERPAGLRANERLIADIAIEADYELYWRLGGEAQTRSYILELMAEVSAIYERDINVQLNPSFIRIATTPNDPWTATRTDDALNELMDYWNTNEVNRPRALVLLLSGREFTEAGGRAYLNGVCDANRRPGRSYDYAVAGYLASSPGVIFDPYIVAHEIGHSFGSLHSHCYQRANNEWYDRCFNQEPGCYSGATVATNGTVMSYCRTVTTPLSFTDGDPVMIDVMRNYAESVTELSAMGCLRVDDNGVESLQIEDVWTADENGRSKTAFMLGDTIRHYVTVNNLNDVAQSAEFEWAISGPCNFNDGYIGTLNISVGISYWYLLNRSIPNDACSGTYNHTVSINHNGQTVSDSTTFTVEGTMQPTATPDPGSNTFIRINPASQTAALNTETCVDVIVDSTPAMGSFQFTLNFPANLLRVTDISAGAFLGSTGRNIVPFEEIDNANGVATYGQASFGSQAGASGSGTLAMVCFTPQAAGTATLSLSASQLTDVPGNNLNHNRQGGNITISDCYWADLDCDGDVDVVDIQLVAGRWNSSAGDGTYDAKYDLDNDGDIDVVDVQRIASQWNWRASRQPTTQIIEDNRATIEFSLMPADLEIAPNQTFTVALEVANADNLAAFETVLRFDPTHLRVESVSLTDFLSQTGRNVNAVEPSIDVENGSIAFGAFSMGSQSGVSGSGTIALIRMTALGEGSGTLDVDATQATDPYANEHNVIEQDGAYTVSGTPTAVRIGSHRAMNSSLTTLIVLFGFMLVGTVYMLRRSAK